MFIIETQMQIAMCGCFSANIFFFLYKTMDDWLKPDNTEHHRQNRIRLHTKKITVIHLLISNIHKQHNWPTNTWIYEYNTNNTHQNI